MRAKLQIIEAIGHGQFSDVYKARLIETNQSTSNDWPSSSELLSTLPSPQQQESLREDPATRLVEKPSINQKRKSQKPQPGQIERYVAVKRIKFYDIQSSQTRMDFKKEVELLRRLKHPNIINCLDSFMERNEMYIVLEYAGGGDLSKLIRYFRKKNQLIVERTILKYFTQVCSAVEYIHSMRVLHRDIKPANIFTTPDGTVKLGDFGLGRFFDQNNSAHSFVGTFYYMSPERVRASGYSFSSDIWSLGCVLYELITLNSPFSTLVEEAAQPQDATKRPLQQRQPIPEELPNCSTKPNPPKLVDNQQAQQQNSPYSLPWLFERITRADYPRLDSYNHVRNSLRHLVNLCLNPNPNTRPTITHVCRVVNEAYFGQ